MLELRVFLGVFLSGVAATACVLLREPTPVRPSTAEPSVPAPAPLSELLEVGVQAQEQGRDVLVQVSMKPLQIPIQVTSFSLYLQHCWHEFDGVRTYDWYPVCESHDEVCLESLPLVLTGERVETFRLQHPSCAPEPRAHGSWAVKVWITADQRSGSYGLSLGDSVSNCSPT